jgi:hypothetical protein
MKTYEDQTTMDYSYFKVKMLIVFVVTLVWGPRAGLAFVLLAMVYEPLIESRGEYATTEISAWKLSRL